MATIAMREAIDLVRASRVRRGQSENTIKAYTTDVRLFFEEMGIFEIDIADLEDTAALWMNTKRRQVAPKTLGRRITSMRALGACLKLKLLEDYSAPTPAPAVPHPLPGLENDLRNMIRAAKTDEQKCLLALTGLCGARITEALSAGPNDFDLNEMQLTIRGKGDKTRVVPISPLAWQVMCASVISAKLSGEDRIVRFADRHARDLITKLGVRAGISRPVSSHDLRATFATIAYRNSGKDIRAVQQLLGHSSILQTQLYTGVTMAAMRGAADFEMDLEEE